MTTSDKYIYSFGLNGAEGDQSMKSLLGGKGANLAEMCRVGLPVPPGLTITTEACAHYVRHGRESVMALLDKELKAGVAALEAAMGRNFGDPDHPLLLSVRSGARASMPGMMDTVLNLGMNDRSVEGLAQATGKERFAWDSYRRFIQMYADVVMKINQSSKNGEDALEALLHALKKERGAETDQDLTVDDLKTLVERYKAEIGRLAGRQFPQDPWEQLWSAALSVFDSWETPRAVYYRKINRIPNDWYTAVNVQCMVFGNMGADSGSGVCFTRDAATGENLFNGEYLLDAQGEDVVAGIRTPRQITREGSLRWARAADIPESERAVRYQSLEEAMPEVYAELFGYQRRLEEHYTDMQDMEFTIEAGKLWILQTRTGKRTGRAMIKIAMDMWREGMIDEANALKRIDPAKIDEVLHPVFDNEALKQAQPLTRGLPASPGAATGQLVFTADNAITWSGQGKPVILVRNETSADDLKGMHAAAGVLTARGGMTSHAAVVARGMGKCCISGAGELDIDYEEAVVHVNGQALREGDWISLNGSTGEVFAGRIPTREATIDDDLRDLLELADRHATMKVKANADTPDTALAARDFGAKGIGLCRTEHMFFEGGRIKAVREMIMAGTEAGRRKALDKLLPMQRSDFREILKAMEGYPVTIRLIDPPLHEFMPYDAEQQEELARELGVGVEAVAAQVEKLREVNPMLGHRGCRLGITFPEITEMQVRAILEAALDLSAEGVDARPEIMIPLVGTPEEFGNQRDVVQATAKRVFEERGREISFATGTMIEVPRAALVAGAIAGQAEFFSFGTNDLTQMTFGYSRDDAGKFLPVYLERGILRHDPFEVLDTEGVGSLMRLCVDAGKQANPGLVLGICGEHGGEPSSIAFCQTLGLDYVSCSPFRVPVARVAAGLAGLG